MSNSGTCGGISGTIDVAILPNMVTLIALDFDSGTKKNLQRCGMCGHTSHPIYCVVINSMSFFSLLSCPLQNYILL